MQLLPYLWLKAAFYKSECAYLQDVSNHKVPATGTSSSMTMEPAVSEKLHPYNSHDGYKNAGPASNDAGIGEHHGGDYVEGDSSYKNHRSENLAGRCYHKKYAQDNCSSKQKLKCCSINHTASKKLKINLLTTK